MDSLEEPCWNRIAVTTEASTTNPSFLAPEMITPSACLLYETLGDVVSSLREFVKSNYSSIYKKF